MPQYQASLDALVKERARTLGRGLNVTELAAAQVETIESLVESGHAATIVAGFLREFSRAGGQFEIQTLGRALVKARDFEGARQLFRGLISRRVKAFCSWWPRAEAGDVGAMREAAAMMSTAMDAYSEYFNVLEQFKRSDENESLRAEMQRLQARLPLRKILLS